MKRVLYFIVSLVSFIAYLVFVNAEARLISALSCLVFAVATWSGHIPGTKKYVFVFITGQENLRNIAYAHLLISFAAILFLLIVGIPVLFHYLAGSLPPTKAAVALIVFPGMAAFALYRLWLYYYYLDLSRNMGDDDDDEGSDDPKPSPRPQSPFEKNKILKRIKRIEDKAMSKRLSPPPALARRQEKVSLA